MKKQHKILILSGAFIAALLALVLLWPSKKTTAPTAKTATLDDYQQSIGKSTETFYIPAQIQIHNKPTSCWVIIGDGVYDVTSLLGSEKAFNPVCGSRANEMVAASKTYKDTATAQQLLKSHRIGAVAPQYQ